MGVVWTGDRYTGWVPGRKCAGSAAWLCSQAPEKREGVGHKGGVVACKGGAAT